MDTTSMDKPGQFQRKAVPGTRPPLGERPQSWVNVFPYAVYVSIRGISTREKMRMGAVQMTATHTIGTRFHPDIAGLQAGELRFSYNGRLFNIVGVDNLDEDDEWLVFTCQEGTQTGD